jgi:hypothetical protein
MKPRQALEPELPCGQILYLFFNTNIQFYIFAISHFSTSKEPVSVIRS